MSLGPIAAAAATGIQVGAAIVATRYVIDQSGPATLALWRYAIGALCLAPFVLARRASLRFRPADLPPIALLGVAQFGILIALLNFGLQHIPAARGALILATFPLQTMVFGALLGRERLTRAKTLGVLLTLAGVALALGAKAFDPTPPGAASWLGELAVLAAAACGALCSILYRPYLQRYPALPTGLVAMLASVAFLVLLASFEAPVLALPGFSAAGWSAVLFIGVSSGIGYFLWLWALQRTTPTRVTVFLGLSPVTAMLLGAVLLGEPVTPAGIGGLALVALGLVAATRD